MNIQTTLSGESLIDVAIERIKYFQPFKGYYLAFSGGKDSIVCYHLLRKAAVKFDSHYNLTTLDPPELVRFIKTEYPDVTITYPELTFWELMRKKKFPPTRQVRYCCDKLKERGGENRFVITGIRWAESVRRKHSRKVIEFDSYGSKSKPAIENREIFLHSDNDARRKMIDVCQVKGKHILNPIIDWEDTDVWEFIQGNNLSYPGLYDQGFKRLGCIGCPLTSYDNRKKEFERWPKYKHAFIRVFNDLIRDGHKDGIYTDYKNGEIAFNFYLQNGYLHGK